METVKEEKQMNGMKTDKKLYELQLSFGAMAPKLSYQLKGHGIPHKDMKLFDRIADSIVLLQFKGLITDSEVHKARQKFVKNVIQKALLKP
jgi:hypothetical protein